MTGIYPFEGETIFRLFENIAKGQFSVPRTDVDPLLENLIRGMLATNPDDRFNLNKVKEHDWCRKNHPCNAPPVTVTPKGEDHTLSTSVLPYLVDLHNSKNELEDEEAYITEHDLHEHKRQMEAEAAAIVRGRLERQPSKTTKCIKVKKMTGCSVS